MTIDGTGFELAASGTAVDRADAGIPVPIRRTDIGNVPALDNLDADTYELALRVLVNNDISGLDDKQRLQFVTKLATGLGMNIWTQPFMFIDLPGKDGVQTKLYATKNAGEQLRRNHGLSVKTTKAGFVAGLPAGMPPIYEVHAEVSSPDGRTSSAIGVVFVAANAKGDDIANAMMKAQTKAQRRATLAHMGLGMLDESEAMDMVGTEPETRNVTPRTALPAKAQTAGPLPAEAILEGIRGYHQAFVKKAVKTSKNPNTLAPESDRAEILTALALLVQPVTDLNDEQAERVARKLVSVIFQAEEAADNMTVSEAAAIKRWMDDGREDTLVRLVQVYPGILGAA